MNATSAIPPTKSRPNVAAGIIMRFAQIAIVFVLQALILFAAAGRLDWIWAWVYLGIDVMTVAINSIFLRRINPETIAERGQPKEMKDWDKVVSGLWALALYLAVPLVAGLDERFGWTPEPGAAWNIAGAAVLEAGLALFSWAMIVNAYFSTAARIQSDRGQTVCRTGPYRFVRHPGYVGAIFQSLGTPILLGSLWGLIPGLIAAALIVVRTAFEDRMLQAELPGYPDYARDVRYRLVPGIW